MQAKGLHLQVQVIADPQVEGGGGGREGGDQDSGTDTHHGQGEGVRRVWEGEGG